MIHESYTLGRATLGFISCSFGWQFEIGIYLFNSQINRNGNCIFSYMCFGWMKLILLEEYGNQHLVGGWGRGVQS